MTKKLLAIVVILFIMISVNSGCNNKSKIKNTDNLENITVEDGMVKNFYKAITDELGEDYLPDSRLEVEELITKYKVNVDSIKDFIAEESSVETCRDTLIIIEAEEGKSKEVEENLTSFNKSLLENAEDAENKLLVAKNSKVLKADEYIFLLIFDENINEAEKGNDYSGDSKVDKVVKVIKDEIEK